MEMEMKMETEQFNHFSHRHPLVRAIVHENDQTICSGCELDLSGPAYICSKPSCNFVLHDLCFDLPRQIRHRSHPNHNLTLLFSPPYGDNEFTCDACGNSGHGFTYHCSKCKFDLHVECASLPEIENRYDHEHPLTLLYSLPDHQAKGDGNFCYVCQDPLGKKNWAYCCLSCECVTHLDCVFDEEYCHQEIKDNEDVAVLEVDVC